MAVPPLIHFSAVIVVAEIGQAAVPVSFVRQGKSNRSDPFFRPPTGAAIGSARFQTPTQFFASATVNHGPRWKGHSALRANSAFRRTTMLLATVLRRRSMSQLCLTRRSPA